MAKRKIRSIDHLFYVLGGRKILAERLGLRESSLIHWQNKGFIPPYHYPGLYRMLDAINREADISMFRWVHSGAGPRGSRPKEARA